MTNRELMQIAEKAKNNAYAPYSDFHVGAVLLTKGGKIYTGCNIENASYGAAMCAERVAIYKAVSAGETDFTAIAVTGSTDPCPPCGICRQVLSEFCHADFQIITKAHDELESITLGELLPKAFELRNTLCK